MSSSRSSHSVCCGGQLQSKVCKCLKHLGVVSECVHKDIGFDKLVEWNHAMHPCFGVALVCNKLTSVSHDINLSIQCCNH
jgi:hypothetical protein